MGLFGKFPQKNRSIYLERGLLFVALLSTFGLYAGTLHYPFVFDDLIGITKNPQIRLTSLSMADLIKAPAGSIYATRPVAMMSFALNYYLHQYHVWGYRLINILIHLVTGWLLFLFVRARSRIRSV